MNEQCGDRVAHHVCSVCLEQSEILAGVANSVASVVKQHIVASVVAQFVAQHVALIREKENHDQMDWGETASTSVVRVAEDSVVGKKLCVALALAHTSLNAQEQNHQEL